jgi:hypothetical protein
MKDGKGETIYSEGSTYYGDYLRGMKHGTESISLFH